MFEKDQRAAEEIGLLRSRARPSLVCYLQDTQKGQRPDGSYETANSARPNTATKYGCRTASRTTDRMLWSTELFRSESVVICAALFSDCSGSESSVTHRRFSHAFHRLSRFVVYFLCCPSQFSRQSLRYF